VTATAEAAGRVLLIGMMGAGKSTVGRATGSLLGWSYFDNDELLARATGKSTREVLEQDGERALRRAERRALDIALSEAGPLIAGVAGGIVTDPLDWQRLRTGGFVVWLRASLGLLARRIAGTNRPWLGDSPLVALEHLYAGREALYSSVADLVVDVDAREPGQIARLIAGALPATPAPRSSICRF
jgi:shikimate kinase